MEGFRFAKSSKLKQSNASVTARIALVIHHPSNPDGVKLFGTCYFWIVLGIRIANSHVFHSFLCTFPLKPFIECCTII